jgi:acetylornithine deacetylase/succinyl-diaminopimelate desuccinylase-like protein
MRLAWLAATSMLGAAESAAAPADNWVSAWRSTHETQIIRTLADYTAVQSIADNPAGLRTMATTLRNALAQRGFAARLLKADPDAPPVVFAEFKTPGARRTVVFYAHYDGQPITPSEWHSGPFAPVLRKSAAPDSPLVDLRNLPAKVDPEWRLFGRAASDDKSSIVAFLFAWDALKASGRRPSINIKVFWEGEEERSSPHLTQYLNQHRSDLAADLWLIGDATWHQSRKPTIYFGARGILSAQFKVYGPRRPLHSGYYGNWAPNPAFMLAKLFTDLRNSDGSVNIPGFNDDVLPLRPAERQAIAALPSVETALKADAGIAASEGGDDVVSSTMRPTLNIKSFQAGGAVNAIPASAEALVGEDHWDVIVTRVEGK